MYNILATKNYLRDLKKLKKAGITKSRIRRALILLQKNPFNKSLRTHQVNIPKLGKVYSSRVTGDIRIIWEFDSENRMTIIAIRIGGHDRVYS